MQAVNAAKLCDDRGFRWQLEMDDSGHTHFCIETADGHYLQPLKFTCDSPEATVNGQVVVLVLGSHKAPVPPRDNYEVLPGPGGVQR
jgi:hypothetical protein